MEERRLLWVSQQTLGAEHLSGGAEPALDPPGSRRPVAGASTTSAKEVQRLCRKAVRAPPSSSFHEHLIKDHGFGWSYTWLELHLQWSGVVPKARARAHTGASASGGRFRA